MGSSPPPKLKLKVDVPVPMLPPTKPELKKDLPHQITATVPQAANSVTVKLELALMTLLSKELNATLASRQPLSKVWHSSRLMKVMPPVYASLSTMLKVVKSQD